MRKLSGKFHFFLRFCTRKRSKTYVVNTFYKGGSKVAEYKSEQECIPVGCVPPAALAVCWGGDVCRSACWDTPPLGLGLGLDIPPHWTEFLTHACENITFPQLRLRTVIIRTLLVMSRRCSCWWVYHRGREGGEQLSRNINTLNG